MQINKTIRLDAAGNAYYEQKDPNRYFIHCVSTNIANLPGTGPSTTGFG
jgi:hypothetical protein